jgi:hypothetical protein
MRSLPFLLNRFSDEIERQGKKLSMKQMMISNLTFTTATKAYGFTADTFVIGALISGSSESTWGIEKYIRTDGKVRC